MEKHDLDQDWRSCGTRAQSGTQEEFLGTPHDLGIRRGWVVGVTPRPRFILGERTPGTHCTGGWVGLTAGLDTEARGRISCLYWGSNLSIYIYMKAQRFCMIIISYYQMMLRVNFFYTNQKRWEVIGCLNRLPKNAFNCFVHSLPVIIFTK
jgi:hypothetical protein